MKHTLLFFSFFAFAMSVPAQSLRRSGVASAGTTAQSGQLTLSFRLEQPVLVSRALVEQPAGAYFIQFFTEKEAFVKTAHS